VGYVNKIGYIDSIIGRIGYIGGIVNRVRFMVSKVKIGVLMVLCKGYYYRHLGLPLGQPLNAP